MGLSSLGIVAINMLYTYLTHEYANIFTMIILGLLILFVFLYLINITIYSLSYINISLIVLRKQQNIIKAIILSVLVFVGIEVFLEIVVNGLIFGLIFKSEIFNIMNLLIFNINYGVSKLLIFTISFFLLTFILVLILYKNKEKLIIDCEKNN